MQMSKTGDLAVIIKAKDLSSYILTVTEKSPKRFRFTLTSRLQNYSLTIIENLILANEIYVQKTTMRAMQEAVVERRYMQRKAMAHLKLLSFMAQTAMESKCILPKQFEQISKKVYDTQNLLGAWMNSDKKRYDVPAESQG